jgi:type IV secretory pathway TrbD component
MKAAADILNANGFDIEVKTDINALKKLNNGDLTVWAAAWGAGVDPDMYQVYHKDSTASSTLNWGYRAILKNAGGKYDRELAIVEELSEIIDKARETLKEDERKAYYAEALDLVMDLAVELPTYQRSDLFAYNTNIIDESTLTPAADLTPFNGPMAKLWEVGLKESDGAGASNSTVVIIVIVAIVAVAGAGVGVFFVLKNKKAKAAAAKAPATTAPKATAEVKLEEEATTPEEENND